MAHRASSPEKRAAILAEVDRHEREYVRHTNIAVLSVLVGVILFAGAALVFAVQTAA